MSRLCDKRLRRYYLDFNKKYHDGKLSLDVDVLFAPVEGHCACAEWDTNGEIAITINPAYVLQPWMWKIQLHHEMQHMASGDMRHGAKFYAEQDRLYALGAYKGLL